MTTKVEIVPAVDDDAAALVDLFAESSGGVLPAVWEVSATPSETLESAGKRALVTTNKGLCVANTVIARAGDALLGAMCCYEESPTDAFADALPASLQKTLSLFSSLHVPNSWFIAELCCRTEARGRGVGTALLHHAMAQAETQQLPQLSLRVFSANTAAIRLYQRLGFTVRDERALVPHPRMSVKGSVYAMVRDLG
ncbi:MAG: GNAT family N-acetyltransferase [Pseudomonadota bacterium]